jgi:anti-sigma B factor antagonist
MMVLSVGSRIVGDVTVLQCDGGIVEAAAPALRQHVTKALEHTPAIVLDLRGVSFIDSSGLGVLVRILARTGHDNLKLCGLTSRTLETLKITRLSTVFDVHESETDAIAAFYRESSVSTRPSAFVAPTVLCVDKSPDVLTYMREVLRQAGFSVATADNVPDAVTLLKATTPKVVLLGGDMRSAGTTGTVEIFNRLLEAVSVVEMSTDFAREDPRDTGPRLIEHVRGFIGHP